MDAVQEGMLDETEGVESELLCVGWEGVRG